MRMIGGLSSYVRLYLGTRINHKEALLFSGRGGRSLRRLRLACSWRTCSLMGKRKWLQSCSVTVFAGIDACIPL